MQIVENLVITTHSAEETTKFGAGLAERLREGDNLLLLGELGAGKTTLLQGLGRGLGIKRNIISPTFQLVRRYNLDRGKEFIHIDLYRLESPEEIVQIGWREMTEGSSIVAVEWADRAKGIWPDKSYIIKMAVSGKDRRRIELIESK